MRSPSPHDYISDWHYIDDNKPQKSGRYLVVARVYTTNGKLNHVFLNNWDNRKQSFTYDLNRKEKRVGADEERIYAWLPYKRPPHPKPIILT